MPISFFAPILESTQDVFQLDNTGIEYKINYTIPNMMNELDIGHLQVRIVGYLDNQNYIQYNESNSPDGILYVKFVQGEHFISIPTSCLIGQRWIPGLLYKIQLRFGQSPLWGEEKFSDWRDQQINKFSEWSNVMVIKPIEKPTLSINGQEGLPDSEIITVQNTEITLTPTFTGTCKFKSESKEIVEKYKFDLYDDKRNLIESSGWKLKAQDSQQDVHRFKTLLKNRQTYQVTYDIQSNNNYRSDLQDSPSTATYLFETREQLLPPIDGISLEANDYSIDSLEDAKIKIYLSSSKELFGNYILVRSSEKTNFTVWEDLTYLSYFGTLLNKQLVYIDYTIENGVGYKYAIQKEGSQEFRTPLIYENESPKRESHFEYSYLYREDSQLKLKFNNKVSSFKNTVLQNKSDTLGSKYPTIMRNGNAYYAEFPIAGLITLQSDEFDSFFKKEDDGYYFKGQKIIESKEKLSTQLTDYNIKLEKIFRDCVEMFLNDGKPKLYKSATEGNLIVNLMNVSLTPIQSLGRMVYEFSATAYEIADNSIDNLKYHGIIKDSPKIDFSNNSFDFLSFGQISGEFIGTNSPQDKQNLIEEIKKDIQSTVGENYTVTLKKLSSFRIQDFSDSTEASSVLHLIVNGKPYVVGANKTYYINDSFGDILIESLYLKETGSIILDYTYKAVKELKEPVMVRTKQTSLIWGQINGVFSNQSSGYTQDILGAIEQNLDEQIHKKYPNRVNMLACKKDLKESNSKYRIKQFLFISIEADQHTVLKVINKNGAESRIELGPTEKYIINPADDLIRGISFESPSYALVDYKCYVDYIDMRDIG